MNPSDSGIFSLASVGSYLDALSSITAEMSLRDRSSLIFIDKCLHQQWGLGQNVILNWCNEPRGIGLLVVPHYAIAEYASRAGGAEIDEIVDNERRVPPSQEFFRGLLSRERHLTSLQMEKVSRLLGIERTVIPLRDPLPDVPAQRKIIEKMIQRYSISYVPHRAVALFDIVGFSLLNPFEQMCQINSLSYSLNSAQSKLLSKKIDINFARSNTGDGFYIWNRDLSLEANINLYHLMHLVLADNAIARRKGRIQTVPRLRASFHIGSCYEFHQAEGLNPTLYNYIVGDVTVELARMIDRALPDQILVGDFNADFIRNGNGNEERISLDSVDFILSAKEHLAQLEGIELSGERVDAIKCYLTGPRVGDGEFTIRRIVINDKHGIAHHVFNAKVNIYRENAEPILLGIEDKKLGVFNHAPANEPAPIERVGP